MNSSTFSILAALVVQVALGLAVFHANRHRKANQCFLLLSLVAAAWLCSLYYILTARFPELATFWIRQASSCGALLLMVFNLLRLSIRNEGKTWRKILSQSWVWLVMTAVLVAFCQTKFFLEGARFSQKTGAFIPVYGSRSIFYFGYFIVAG